MLLLLEGVEEVALRRIQVNRKKHSYFLKITFKNKSSNPIEFHLPKVKAEEHRQSSLISKKYPEKTKELQEILLYFERT